MEITDWLLLLIAGLMAAGIGVYVWNARRRAAETEMMRSAMYAIAAANPHFRTYDPIPVTFDPSVNKAITRFAKTAVDMQGMIELSARWMVSQMPPAVIEDMEVPKDWTSVTRISRQGLTKEE